MFILDAVGVPSQVTVVHSKGLQKGNSLSNAFPDPNAKPTALKRHLKLALISSV
jgi:hypothetical protein